MSEAVSIRIGLHFSEADILPQILVMLDMNVQFAESALVDGMKRLPFGADLPDEL